METISPESPLSDKESQDNDLDYGERSGNDVIFNTSSENVDAAEQVSSEEENFEGLENEKVQKTDKNVNKRDSSINDSDFLNSSLQMVEIKKAEEVSCNSKMSSGKLEQDASDGEVSDSEDEIANANVQEGNLVDSDLDTVSDVSSKNFENLPKAFCKPAQLVSSAEEGELEDSQDAPSKAPSLEKKFSKILLKNVRNKSETVDEAEEISEDEEGLISDSGEEGELPDSDEEKQKRRSKSRKQELLEEAEEGEEELEPGEITTKSRRRKKKPKEDLEEGEVVDDDDDNDEESSERSDLDEGEIISDREIDSIASKEDRGFQEHEGYKSPPRATCRFFNRGQCFWGQNCRFAHIAGDPGKGFPVSGPPSQQANKPIVSSPPSAHVLPDNWSAPPVEVPENGEAFPVPPSSPPTETAWERGLRKAKEALRNANMKKEMEPDYEDKCLNLTVEGPEVRPVESKIEIDVKPPILSPRLDTKPQPRGLQDEPFPPAPSSHVYENFEVHRTEFDRHLERHVKEKEIAMMDKRRQKEQRERRPSPPVDKYGRHKDLRYSRMAKEPLQAKPKRPDEWHDPWRRSTTPKKKLGSKSPHRRRRSLSSSSASYSGSSRSSSYSSSSRSSSGSSYSSSYSSRSSSGSRSPSPRRRRQASGPRSSKHPLIGSIRTPAPVTRTTATLGNNVTKPIHHTRKLMHLKPPLDSAIKKVSPDVVKQADRGRQLTRPSVKDRTGPMPMVSARADLAKLRPGRPLVSERHKLLEKPIGNRNLQLPPDIDGVPMDESLPQAFARNKAVPKMPSKPTHANRQSRRHSLSYTSSSSSSRSRSRSRSRYKSSRSRSRSSSSSSSVSSRSSRSAENRGNKKPEVKNLGKVKSTVNTNLGTEPNVKKPFALSHKPIKLTLLNKPAETRPQPRMEKSIFETLKPDKLTQPEREHSRSAKQDALPKAGDKQSFQTPAAKGTAAKSSTGGSSSSRKRAASPQAPARLASKTTLPSQKSQAAAAAAKKTSMSRREELLKQLKAVEEAIAKKRAKLA